MKTNVPEYNPYDYRIPDIPDKWRLLCFRLIGRSIRFENWKKLKKEEGVHEVASRFIKEEKKLIKKAIQEMQDNCMEDEDFKMS